ncbi:uncharacterized protein FIBRA_06714 [Fibroporia radiculosa]|uniref:Methyltransferase domain-containing protein n=1 Tax=Fibroporia radiculosa TaxID=599839 RepID=J4GCA5_9APHY|nr:uncharacterized protein FIBRA_06714 [Fibroporia radiculosa]CCM04533.1 predicted protein [Fibroporia radiculosa]
MSHFHEHEHEHAHAFSAANKEHFDKTAHEFDERPHAQALARSLAAAMRTRYPDLFIEDTTAMMEYACGTGLTSRELCPYVKSVVGVDISSGMVEQFNLKASNQGLAPEEMKALCIELKGSDDELDGQKFDVIVCTLSYHHFPSVKEVTRVLAFFLKPGGSLLVSDVQKGSLKEDIFADHPHIVAHQRGFDEGEMRSVFEGAGLTSFEFSVVCSGKLHGRPVDFFLARGLARTALQSF